LDAAGNPTTDPIATKRQAAKQIGTVLDEMAHLNATKRNAQLKQATVEIGEAEIKIDEFSARPLAAEYKQSFNRVVSATLSGLLQENNGAWLNGPPDAAIGEFRNRLIRVQNLTEYNEFAVRANDPTFFDKMVDQHVQTAQAILTGNNMKTLKTYSKDVQRVLLDTIADAQLLGLGPQAAGMFQNAERFQQLAGAAVQQNALRGVQGFEQSPLGAALSALSSMESINTLRGRLTLMTPKPQAALMTGDIDWIVGDLMQDMQSFTGGVPTGITPFGMLQKIKEVQSHPSVQRWITAGDVPEANRTKFIQAINRMESMVLSLGAVSVEDLESINRKEYKPAPEFSGLSLGGR
jgi:hypothetical protein